MLKLDIFNSIIGHISKTYEHSEDICDIMQPRFNAGFSFNDASIVSHLRITGQSRLIRLDIIMGDDLLIGCAKNSCEHPDGIFLLSDPQLFDKIDKYIHAHVTSGVCNWNQSSSLIGGRLFRLRSSRPAAGTE